MLRWRLLICNMCNEEPYIDGLKDNRATNKHVTQDLLAYGFGLCWVLVSPNFFLFKTKRKEKVDEM